MAVGVFLLLACAPGHVFAQRSADRVATRPRFARVGTTVAWNEIARALVAEHHTDPPRASRAYALLAVAQYEIALSIRQDSSVSQRQTSLSSLSALPSLEEAIAAASAAVLSYMFPDDTQPLRSKFQEQTESRRGEGTARDALEAGEVLGLRVAETLIERARTDRSDDTLARVPPLGPGKWYSSARPPLPAVLPMWGSVKSWVTTSTSQFRPEPPPAFNSPQFLAALSEVRRLSDSRTAEQLRTARYWADGPGTSTPPGHWNAIAADLIARYQLSDRQATRVFALLNVAMMDAGITCWDAKYTYWLIRPSAVDARITTPIGVPNFPSYTSGHASFSGAASEVLGYLFPAEADSLRAMAEEASWSRVYAGIHYRFDTEQGLRQGRSVARLVVALDRKHAGTSPFWR